MKKHLLVVLTFILVISRVFVLATSSLHIKDLIFITDAQKPQLLSGETAVFPYSDEASVLLDQALKIKMSRGKEFNLVIDPFCGDGKSGLPIIFYSIGSRLIGSDINPRAIQFAKSNATANLLDTKSDFSVRDILKDGLPPSDAPGNTLWIANPPFALHIEGTHVDVMRNGGINGLIFTTTFVSKALQLSYPGDVILGLGYSRIRSDNSIEMEEQLLDMTQRYGGILELILLEEQQLWRDIYGCKKQNNPMAITEELFCLKADPNNQQEIEAYQQAARLHIEAGYDRIGYYCYIITK